jgi:hypothetical protein
MGEVCSTQERLKVARTGCEESTGKHVQEGAHAVKKNKRCTGGNKQRNRTNCEESTGKQVQGMHRL